MAKFTPSKSSKAHYDKWSTGYYGKAKGTKFEQSSFWMDDNYLSDLIKADTGHDVIRMASYQRSIANFVKILTNRDDIKVRFHRKGDFHPKGGSYTDGKTVTISSKLDTKNFDATVGLALHEGSHCALTQFTARVEYMRNLVQQGINLAYPNMFSDLVNIIEDRRIDYYVMQNAPGYQGYYKTFYAEYFNSKEIDKALQTNVMNQESVDHYIFHVCNFMNPNRNLNALKKLKEIWKEYDLANIGRLKNTMEVCELAHRIHDIIASAVVQLGKNGGNNDPKNNEKDKQKGEKDQGGEAGKEDGMTNPGEGDQDQMDPMDELEQGQGGEGAGNNKDNDDDQDLNDDGDSGSEEDGDAESGDVTAPPVPISPKLAKAIRAQQEFIRGELNKKSVTDKLAEQVNAMVDSDVNIETVTPNKANENAAPVEVVVVKGTSPAILNSEILDAHYHKSRHGDRNRESVEAGWVLGTMLGKKLKTRDENRSMKSTRLKSGKMEGRLMAELGFGNTQVFSQILHYTVKPCTLHLSIDASGSMGGEKWDAAIKTAVAIGKACSMISNVRVIIDIRGQASGAGAKGHNTHNSRALVWVVYDSKKDNVSVLRTIFSNLYCGAATPEGLCFDAIMKYIIGNAKGQDAYFINISDGEPAFNGYHGDVAVAHTQKQVNKMRANNINVLSFFATERTKERALASSVYNDFQKMYGKDAALIDLNDFNALARSLNSLFERGVDA